MVAELPISSAGRIFVLLRRSFCCASDCSSAATSGVVLRGDFGRMQDIHDRGIIWGLGTSRELCGLRVKMLGEGSRKH